MLPQRQGDAWFTEKVEIAFEVVMNEAVELGYSQQRLEDSLDEVLAVVSDLLSNEDNWTSFYQSKKDEAQHREDRHRYRGEANRGELSSEGAEWLRQNDKDFLENMAMKNNTSVDVLLAQLMAKVDKITRPVETPEARYSRILQRIEAVNAPLPETKAPSTNGSMVTVEYRGGMHGFSINGQTVEYGSVVEVTSEQFERLQSGHPAGWWTKA